MKNKKLLIIPIALLVALIPVFVIFTGNKDKKNGAQNEDTTVTPTPTMYIEPTGTDDEKATRNQIRKGDVSQLVNGLAQYKIENKNFEKLGKIPSCPDTVVIGTGEGNLDIATHLVGPYFAVIPKDPLGTDQNTGYAICTNTDGTFEVSSVLAEKGEEIKKVSEKYDN